MRFHEDDAGAPRREGRGRRVGGVDRSRLGEGREVGRVATAAVDRGERLLTSRDRVEVRARAGQRGSSYIRVDRGIDVALEQRDRAESVVAQPRLAPFEGPRDVVVGLAGQPALPLEVTGN